MTFASRAGEKLDFALENFGIDVQNKICTDFGASAGGFTDVLIQKGAKKVYAVDTGYGEFDWNLRNNPKVVLMERTNALRVELPEKMDFISIDTSWTKQKNIIPVALKFLKDDGNIVSLIKPQYEAEKNQLDKGKVKEEFLSEIIEKVKEDIISAGANIKGNKPCICIAPSESQKPSSLCSLAHSQIKDIIKSPIVGKKGNNKEYLIWIAKN